MERERNKITSVCVYCASSTQVASAYREAATELGHLSFCIMILKQRGFNKPSTEIIGLSAFQNHLFSLIYIISEQGEIAQARIIREDMRQGLGYLKRRFQGGGSLLCQTKFQ